MQCGHWGSIPSRYKWSYDFLMPKESSSLMIYLPNKTLVLGNRVLQHTDLFIEPRIDTEAICILIPDWLGWPKMHMKWMGRCKTRTYICTFFDLNWDSIAIFLSGTKANLLYWQSLTFHFVAGHYGPDHLLSLLICNIEHYWKKQKI